MTERPKLLRLNKKRTIALYCNPKLTVKHQKYHLENTDGFEIRPFIIQKVLTNDKYIVRRIITNKTQILHRIRLKKNVPNTPLQDNYAGEKLQPDEEIVIPQDDLYTISWEVDFDYDLFETRKDDWPDTATRRLNDAASGGVDYYVTEDERCSSDEDGKRSGEQANASDVNENQIKPTTGQQPRRDVPAKCIA